MPMAATSRRTRLLNRIANARAQLWGMSENERPTSEEYAEYVAALEALYQFVTENPNGR